MGSACVVQQRDVHEGQDVLLLQYSTEEEEEEEVHNLIGRPQSAEEATRSPRNDDRRLILRPSSSSLAPTSSLPMVVVEQHGDVGGECLRTEQRNATHFTNEAEAAHRRTTNSEQCREFPAFAQPADLPCHMESLLDIPWFESSSGPLSFQTDRDFLQQPPPPHTTTGDVSPHLGGLVVPLSDHRSSMSSELLSCSNIPILPLAPKEGHEQSPEACSPEAQRLLQHDEPLLRKITDSQNETDLVTITSLSSLIKRIAPTNSTNTSATPSRTSTPRQGRRERVVVVLENTSAPATTTTGTTGEPKQRQQRCHHRRHRRSSPGGNDTFNEASLLALLQAVDTISSSGQASTSERQSPSDRTSGAPLSVGSGSNHQTLSDVQGQPLFLRHRRDSSSFGWHETELDEDLCYQNPTDKPTHTPEQKK